METRESQRIVRDRVIPGRSEEQRRRLRRHRRGPLRGAEPVEMSRGCRKNRRPHTGARQQVRGQEPSPAVGEMRLGFRPSPPRQRIQNQKSTAVHVDCVMRFTDTRNPCPIPTAHIIFYFFQPFY